MCDGCSTRVIKSYVDPVLKSWLQTICNGHHVLVERYEISISQIAMDILCRLRLSSITDRGPGGLNELGRCRARVAQ